MSLHIGKSIVTGILRWYNLQLSEYYEPRAYHILNSIQVGAIQMIALNTFSLYIHVVTSHTAEMTLRYVQLVGDGDSGSS